MNRLRIWIVCSMLLLCNTISADNLIRKIYPQRESANFIIATEPFIKGWYITNLNIPQTSLSSGFRIDVMFSTPTAELDNFTILKIGGMYGSPSTYNDGLSIVKDNASFKIKRLVKLNGLDDKTFIYHPRDSNFFDRNKNYVLRFEIDETRMRIGVAEQKDVLVFKYEYEFYGLFYSDFREVLSGLYKSQFYSPAVGIDRRAFVREISVYTLENGIKPLEHKHPTEVAFLTNVLSTHEIIPESAQLTINTELVQESNYSPIWPLWEVIPQFQRDRTPLNYNVKFRNLQSNKYMVVRNADPTNLTPIIQWNDDGNNNSIWSIVRDRASSSYNKLKNLQTGKYAVVKDASILSEAKIVEYESAETQNGQWVIPDESVDSPIATGYYMIQNKNSGLYLSITDNWLRQGANTLQSKHLWYIEKQIGGFYTLRNICSNKDLFTYQNRVHSSYPYLTVDTLNKVLGNTGLNQWVIESKGGRYRIKSAHMNEFVVIQDASTSLDAYAILYPSAETPNSFWEFIPANYTQATIKGGLFKLKNTTTNTYVVIKDASVETGAEAVSYSTAGTPNSWYTFIKDEAGLYLIQNVNSGMYLAVTDRSVASGAKIIQTSSPDKVDVCYKKWHIFLDKDLSYILINANSGLHLSIQNDSHSDLIPIIQRETGLTKSFWDIEAVPLPSQ